MNGLRFAAALGFVLVVGLITGVVLAVLGVDPTPVLGVSATTLVGWLTVLGLLAVVVARLGASHLDDYVYYRAAVALSHPTPRPTWGRYPPKGALGGGVVPRPPISTSAALQAAFDAYPAPPPPSPTPVPEPPAARPATFEAPRLPTVLPNGKTSGRAAPARPTPFSDDDLVMLGRALVPAVELLAAELRARRESETPAEGLSAPTGMTHLSGQPDEETET